MRLTMLDSPRNQIPDNHAEGFGNTANLKSIYISWRRSHKTTEFNPQSLIAITVSPREEAATDWVAYGCSFLFQFFVVQLSKNHKTKCRNSRTN